MKERLIRSQDGADERSRQHATSPDFVIVSPKKYKSSNISRQECKKSGLFSYRGSSLLFYPSFCASPNATRIILDYQAFTSMS